VNDNLKMRLFPGMKLLPIPYHGIGNIGLVVLCWRYVRFGKSIKICDMIKIESMTEPLLLCHIRHFFLEEKKLPA